MQLRITIAMFCFSSIMLISCRNWHSTSIITGKLPICAVMHEVMYIVRKLMHGYHHRTDDTRYNIKINGIGGHIRRVSRNSQEGGGPKFESFFFFFFFFFFFLAFQFLGGAKPLGPPPPGHVHIFLY